jgi:outer membrane biosynthesis protein TonB
MTIAFADIPDLTLAKFANAIVASIKTPTGTVPAAFKDRLGATINTDVSSTSTAGRGGELTVEFKINPDGASAWAKVVSKSPKGSYSIQGMIDVAVLATKLA